MSRIERVIFLGVAGAIFLGVLGHIAIDIDKEERKKALLQEVEHLKLESSPVFQAIKALKTQDFEDERFLGRGALGFQELLELILKKKGFNLDPANVRGITHTRGLVFLALEEGDYKTVESMGEVKNWIGASR